MRTHAEPAPRARCPRCGGDKTHHVEITGRWNWTREPVTNTFEWCDDCNRSFQADPVATFRRAG